MTPTVRITRAQDQARDDLRWWLSRPPEERIAAVEQLRRDHHQEQEGDAEPRLQRVCCVVQRARVEYLVVGGYALAARGRPRYTGDIDLLARPRRLHA
jgi:hypothetical protein